MQIHLLTACIACFVKHTKLYKNVLKLSDIHYATAFLTLYIVNCSWKEIRVFEMDISHTHLKVCGCVWVHTGYVKHKMREI